MKRSVSGQFLRRSHPSIVEDFSSGARRFRCVAITNGSPCGKTFGRNADGLKHLQKQHGVQLNIADDNIADEEEIVGYQFDDDPFDDDDDLSDQHDDNGDGSPGEDADGEGDQLDAEVDIGQLEQLGADDDSTMPDTVMRAYARRANLSDVDVKLLVDVFNVVRLADRPLNVYSITKHSRSRVTTAIACRACGTSADAAKRDCGEPGCSGYV